MEPVPDSPSTHPEDEPCCPHCHRVLVELSRLRDSVYGDAAALTEEPVRVQTDIREIQAFFLLSEFVDMVLDGLAAARRQSRVRRLCAEVLPRFPASLVCARCLFVLRRSGAPPGRSAGGA